MEITKDLTIPKLFYEKAKKNGKNKVAMREKEIKVRELFAQMLEDAAKYVLREKYYAEDMKNFYEVVQW